MAESYQFDTHFESGIGVGIHGEMKTGDVTIVKVGSSLNEFYCEEGTILENQYRKDRCRTQIVIQMNAPVTYFLKSSLGNHHQVIYGHHQKELKAYFESLGLRQIEG
jgi:L-fucose isomerase-like protein